MILLSLLLSFFVHAEEPRTFVVGHNLTATSDTLEGRHCSFGLQVFACRIANKTALGMSPWMLNDYRMVAVALRRVISENDTGDRWAVQTSYFQTITKREDEDGTDYEMTSLWFQLIRTWQMKDGYRLHANLDANYYFNDRLPFSLRRPSFAKTPVQINASVLFQADLTNGWFMLGELGGLDIFRPPFHTHSGVSLGWGNETWSWHLGYSLTATFKALASPTWRQDTQQIIRSYPYASYDDSITDEAIEYDYAIHPEFALQVTF